ncbi:hypothetical protein SBC2_61930 (plasmid) [Caballeronia sp. SBC2]|nr:hypothetical protein SBC2_61930 [Caballeronia sp. SBC2]
MKHPPDPQETKRASPHRRFDYSHRVHDPADNHFRVSAKTRACKADTGKVVDQSDDDAGNEGTRSDIGFRTLDKAGQTARVPLLPVSAPLAWQPRPLRRPVFRPDGIH